MRHQIVRALFLSGGLLAGAIALTAAKRMGLIDPDTTLRGIMALMGMVMAIYANDIPKNVTKVSARGQAIQRMTGRAMLLAYVAWIGIWAFAPLNLANGLAVACVLAPAAVVVFACLRARRAVA